MKKLTYTLFAVVLGVSVFTPIVFGAAASPLPESPIQSFDGGENSVMGLLQKVIVWMYRIFFVIAVLYILIAAFTILTEKDKAKAWEKGKAQLTNAAIAIVVALVASGFAAVVKSFLTS